jgi:enoyl-CoA hydratase/carnithine racemase
MGAETFARASPRIVASIAGVVATVTISAPERRNCIDLAGWTALPPLFAALGQHDGVRVIVLRGAGTQAFCAGADIAEFDTERATAAGSRAYEEANVAAFAAVAACPRPVIAAIRGYCFGAGVGLAASADIRIAADDATFAIPAARLGVGYPPTALASLVALMGPEAVKRLFFTAERLSAVDALNAGLIGEITAKEALDDAVARAAAAIAEGAPLTLRAAKAAIDRAAGLAPAITSDMAQAMADECFASADYAEGRAAFRAKRKPVFTGR